MNIFLNFFTPNNAEQKVVTIQVMGDSLIEFIYYFLTHWATSAILFGAFQQANAEMWIKAAVLHQKYITKRKD